MGYLIWYNLEDVLEIVPENQCISVCYISPSVAIAEVKSFIDPISKMFNNRNTQMRTKCKLQEFPLYAQCQKSKMRNLMQRTKK